MNNARVTVGVITGGTYLASVLAANALTSHYGFVSVGFGYAATAGTFAAGGALVVRDLLQDAIGRVGVLAMIALASGLSYLIADHAIAVASGVAFALAELLDFAIYTPLRKRGRFGGRWWSVAVAAGGVVGALADTIAFLWIAFGREAIGPALTGQMVGKGEVIAGLILLGVAGRAVLRESQH